MRITILLVSVLFLGMARIGAAQTASESTKQRLRSQYLQSDTAQAIINLYSRRQAGGAGWIGGGILGVTRAALAGGGTDNSPYSTQQDPGIAPYLVAASPFVAYGTSKLVRFSNGHLQKVLADYATGQPLPRSLRRKLKPKLFNEPIVKYKPVKIEPVK